MVQIRKSKSNRISKKRTQMQGGAIYSFNLEDKIGGQPARIPLNGTADGDCPATDTKDLGFVNYGLTRGGGSRRRKHSRSNKRSKKTGKKMAKRMTKKM